MIVSYPSSSPEVSRATKPWSLKHKLNFLMVILCTTMTVIFFFQMESQWSNTISTTATTISTGDDDDDGEIVSNAGEAGEPREFSIRAAKLPSHGRFTVVNVPPLFARTLLPSPSSSLVGVQKQEKGKSIFMGESFLQLFSSSSSQDDNNFRLENENDGEKEQQSRGEKSQSTKKLVVSSSFQWDYFTKYPLTLLITSKIEKLMLQNYFFKWFVPMARWRAKEGESIQKLVGNGTTKGGNEKANEDGKRKEDEINLAAEVEEGKRRRRQDSGDPEELLIDGTSLSERMDAIILQLYQGKQAEEEGHDLLCQHHHNAGGSIPVTDPYRVEDINFICATSSPLKKRLSKKTSTTGGTKEAVHQEAGVRWLREIPGLQVVQYLATPSHHHHLSSFCSENNNDKANNVFSKKKKLTSKIRSHDFSTPLPSIIDVTPLASLLTLSSVLVSRVELRSVQPHLFTSSSSSGSHIGSSSWQWVVSTLTSIHSGFHPLSPALIVSSPFSARSAITNDVTLLPRWHQQTKLIFSLDKLNTRGGLSRSQLAQKKKVIVHLKNEEVRKGGDKEAGGQSSPTAGESEGVKEKNCVGKQETPKMRRKDGSQRVIDLAILDGSSAVSSPSPHFCKKTTNDHQKQQRHSQHSPSASSSSAGFSPMILRSFLHSLMPRIRQENQKVVGGKGGTHGGGRGWPQDERRIRALLLHLPFPSSYKNEVDDENKKRDGHLQDMPKNTLSSIDAYLSSLNGGNSMIETAEEKIDGKNSSASSTSSSAPFSSSSSSSKKNKQYNNVYVVGGLCYSYLDYLLRHNDDDTVRGSSQQSIRRAKREKSGLLLPLEVVSSFPGEDVIPTIAKDTNESFVVTEKTKLQFLQDVFLLALSPPLSNRGSNVSKGSSFFRQKVLKTLLHRDFHLQRGGRLPAERDEPSSSTEVAGLPYCSLLITPPTFGKFTSRSSDVRGKEIAKKKLDEQELFDVEDWIDQIFLSSSSRFSKQNLRSQAQDQQYTACIVPDHEDADSEDDEEGRLKKKQQGFGKMVNVDDSNTWLEYFTWGLLLIIAVGVGVLLIAGISKNFRSKQRRPAGSGSPV